jgi:hypothetical protein
MDSFGRLSGCPVRRALPKQALCQGTASAVPNQREQRCGFSRCGASFRVGFAGEHLELLPFVSRPGVNPLALLQTGRPVRELLW